MSDDEAQVREQFEREGLRPVRWTNGPDAVYGEHAHPYKKILIVSSGSIVLTINGGERVVTMKRGDRLELSPHTVHSAVVGAEGVVCFEAHIRAKR
jgi:quercetin dioxygenase-like cupin family protein